VFSFNLFLSIVPFVFFIYLLLWKKVPLLKASLSLLAIVLVLQLDYWQIKPIFILSSFVKGGLVSLDIFLIIFGAIFFLEIVKELKIIQGISFFLESFFKDYRVQVIFLAWFLENFIEGTAGFGTPSIIAVPLLIGLGLTPLNATIISLLGNSSSVVFGAVGTPIRIGLAGLDISRVPFYTSLFNIVGMLVPVFMVWTLFKQQKDSKKHFFEILPFALWSGIAFVVPSVLVVGLGQEFPSILGAVIGLALVLITTRLGIFMPKNKIVLRQSTKEEIRLPIFKLFFPYIFLIFLLIVEKFLLGATALSFPWGLKYSLSFANPGLAFLIAGIPVAIYWKRKDLITSSAKISLKRTMGPFLVIASMSIMTQLVVNSGFNLSGESSVLKSISKIFEVPFLPFLAPLAGAFGSFITGSATVSNMMFGNFLNEASKILSMDSAKILALGTVGGAAGNMIAVADVLSAEVIAGLKNKTGEVIKGVILPCFIYLMIVGILGMVFI
jgi:lactate permease